MSDKFLYPNGSCFNFNTEKLNSFIEERVDNTKNEKEENYKMESIEMRMKKDSNLFVEFKDDKFIVTKDRYGNGEGQEIQNVSDLVKLFSEHDKVIVTNFVNDKSQIRSLKEGLNNLDF